MVDKRIIAFYLPQYHPFPENDEWWGKGFTEWRNVVKARPLYRGHYQPHLPADLGFYDLRVPEVRQQQADMARMYGINGFCYYHYWFNGHQLMERPLEEMLSSGNPDFPFMLCWANENWTRAWDGGSRHILIAQNYSEEDDRAHIRYLLDNVFSDSRYIRVDGKPVFLIYRSMLFPNMKETIRVWREEASSKGVDWDVFLTDLIRRLMSLRFGLFMPTQHLLSLYVQEDGTLDPRFHESFTTEWKANTAYTWDKGTVNRFDRESNVEGKKIEVGQLAIKFIMPQDENYAEESAKKLEKDYLVVDYKDVYDDAKKNVKMNYSYSNPSEGYTSDGKSENLFNFFYPSLNKHNSSNYYVANASKKRNGNLNATFIMRTAEMYLIAAEADIYVNGGSNALKYINKIRTRAGANPLVGVPTINTVLDERARELCGEYARFYDLKRTGMLKDNSYLEEHHPDLAQFFKPEYALRPISTNFTSTLEGGGGYYQNPGY